MLEESDRAWDKVAARSYAFHSLRDECAHLRLLTLQQVGARRRALRGLCCGPGGAWRAWASRLCCLAVRLLARLARRPASLP